MGDLFPRIEWSVQQDPTLDEANVEEVREYVVFLNHYGWCMNLMISGRFLRWVKQDSASYWLRHTSRHQACVMVDKYLLETLLTSPPP